MRIRNLFKRRSAPRPPQRTDWTNTWSRRDWADLPTYHPRGEETRR